MCFCIPSAWKYRAQEGPGGGRVGVGGVVAPGQVLFCVGIVSFSFSWGVLVQADFLICILGHEHSFFSTAATA